MRIILLIILSTVFALNAIGQNADQIQKDSDGNVIALFGSQDSTMQSVIQKGVENLFFIYSIEDSTAGEFQVNQEGYSNRILSIISDEKGSFFQRFDQNGERNRIKLLQKNSSDSTKSGSGEIDIRQKGSGNSVTIIQH